MSALAAQQQCQVHVCLAVGEVLLEASLPQGLSLHQAADCLMMQMLLTAALPQHIVVRLVCRRLRCRLPRARVFHPPSRDQL